MSSKLDKAAAYARIHPEETTSAIADAYNVPRTSLVGRRSGAHTNPSTAAPHAISIPAEHALIDKINTYADRGTLICPRHIRELAQSLCGRPLGVNWATTFLKRHSDELSSRYYSNQEIARLRANTPECRQAFYKLVKSVYETDLYLPCNIYNMDECGLDLSYSCKSRRVASRSHPRKAQAELNTFQHTTIVACIGVQDAPVPPLVIYTGATLQESWFQVVHDSPKQLATVTDSGYTNSYVHLRWLIDIFDPYTKDRANSNRRLLFLDGLASHVSAEFIEACWERNIVCLIFPASMSGIYQPLDVDFFNTLKTAYHNQVDTFQRSSSSIPKAKGMFFEWHQTAWTETASARQIRGAWRKAGLWPLDREVMGAEEIEQPRTPERPSSQINPETPYSLCMLRFNNRKVRSGEYSPLEALFKLEKAYEKLDAESALLRQEIRETREAMDLDRRARGPRGAISYPTGHLFDPQERQDDPSAWAEKKRKDEENRRKRMAAARSEGNAQASNSRS